MMPAWSNSACRVISGAAAAAVCEAAARWPGADCPAWTVRTGMLALTRRAVRANQRGWSKDSRCSTASSVASSASHHSSMSVPETSSLSPTEANEEIPMPSRVNCSTSAAPTPPDCTTKPTWPGDGWCAASVAPSPMPGTATPNEAGPASRMPVSRVASSSPDSCALVSPAVITASDLAPRFPHSCATSTTRAAGTATTARSGASGSAATDETHRMPSMSPPRGLTAYKAPANPASRMLSRIVRPTEPERRPAPITATDLGFSSGSRLATSACFSRWATASRYVLASPRAVLGGTGIDNSTTPLPSLRRTASPASLSTRSTG